MRATSLDEAAYRRAFDGAIDTSLARMLAGVAR
jgi:hypothetical protein